jgi:hypothetical protein
VNDDLAKTIAAARRDDERRVTVAATVTSVNSDGTVNALVDGTPYALPARRSYLVRKVGDQVLVTVRAGEMIVDGPTGVPFQIPTLGGQTISDLSAPSGVGWQEIVSGQYWVRQLNAGDPIEQWYKRVAAYVPPAPTVDVPATLTRTAIGCDTYRGGAGLGRGYAEQGDYSGNGLQTGVWVFGAGAWSPLSGKTERACRVRIKRRAEPHGQYGPTLTRMWLHTAVTMPGATPGMLNPGHNISLSLGQEWTGNVPLAWATAFRTGTAAGIAISTQNASENVEAYADLTVYIDYT